MAEVIKYRFFFLFVFLFILNPGALAQDNENPFELIPRLDPVTQQKIKQKIESGAPDNPFDVVKKGEQPQKQIEEPVVNDNTETKEELIADSKVSDTLISDSNENYRQFLFLSILGLILLLTIIFTLFRILISKIYAAFMNENIMNQLHREGGGIVQIPYLILYFFFFLSAGLFTLLMTKYFNLPLVENNIQSLLLCIGVVVIVFIIHHFLLWFVGGVFPVYKEASAYSFTIKIFNIIIGLMLVPMIIFLAYAPKSMLSFLVPTFLILLALAYLFRYLRGLFIANRFIAFHKFHFLLYICAVEIAPLLILVKLIQLEGA